MNFKSEPAPLPDSRPHLLPFSAAAVPQSSSAAFSSGSMFQGLVAPASAGSLSSAPASAPVFPSTAGTWGSSGQALAAFFPAGADMKPGIAQPFGPGQMPRLPGHVGPGLAQGLPALGPQQQQQLMARMPVQPALPLAPPEPVETTRTIMDRIAAYDAKASKKLDSISDFVEKQLIPSLADADGLFHNLCFFLEQALFTLVDWARNADYFKAVSVEDQMQLLNSSWGEILLLEYLYHCVNDNRMDSMVSWHSTQLQHSADILDLLDLSELKARLMDLIDRVRDLQIDRHEFAALKFLLMFNAGKHDIVLKQNAEFVNAVEFKISCSLMNYMLERAPQQTDKFSKVLLRLPEIKYLAFRLECFLADKLKTGKIPHNTLITEMLLSKSKSFASRQAAANSFAA